MNRNRDYNVVINCALEQVECISTVSGNDQMVVTMFAGILYLSMIEIYKPRPNEWQLLKDIRIESLKGEPGAFRDKLKKEEAFSDEQWRVSLKQSDGSIVLFAKENDRVIGMIGIDNKQGKSHIWGVYVSSEYRGKGIGKMLLESILGEIRSYGYGVAVLTVQPTQERAISLYQSFGFSAVETRIFNDGEKLVMRKEIR
jgi:ribosomal protein S18 acetylase RimI-like enzyme